MTEIYYLFIFILCLISIFIIRPINPISRIHLPPSPPAIPVIGHLHLLTSTLYKSFHSLSSKYGPLLFLRFGSSSCLLVSSASVASEIFKTYDFVFSSRPIFAFADKLPYGNSGFITAPYGDYWRFMKKLCVTELLGPRQLERSKSIRDEEIKRFLLKVFENAHRSKEIDVGAELMKLTNNVTCRMVMSSRCSEKDDEAERIRELVKESFELAAKLCFGDVLGTLKRLTFWVYGKQAMDVSRRYDELLERVLKEHEEKKGRRIGGVENEERDLMDILLEVYQDDKAEFKITRTHIKAFFMDLFIAGTDTSAEAMQWAIAELINHPEVFIKVREEIELVTGNNRLVEESDMPNLPYLQAVVKETLRLYPPGPVTTRECRQNCKVRGYDIPAKTAVAINLYAIMRDPDSWDDPNEFRPERFLVSLKEQYKLEDNQNDTKGQNFNFIPFGAGRRGCPGTTLAFNLMNTTVAAMVQCFNWKVSRDGKGVKVDMHSGPGMSLSMAHPLISLPVVNFDPYGSM
ncbi:Cytochrome P450 family protein [Quillaja saponaria]|uniref:Cytochrome P450 family protein n=1 Tax=Quillaja saponaria TaxID=32244 RepID=A0AAD7L0C8_QUISA|nr:Cytochrome P450 family protein [Quillaja saponaria]